MTQSCLDITQPKVVKIEERTSNDSLYICNFTDSTIYRFEYVLLRFKNILKFN